MAYEEKVRALSNVLLNGHTALVRVYLDKSACKAVQLNTAYSYLLMLEEDLRGTGKRVGDFSEGETYLTASFASFAPSPGKVHQLFLFPSDK